MANSYWNVTGLAVQYGLNSAMRTLAPQAVGSGKSRELSGIHVQRAAMIAVSALIPSLLLAVHADKILVAAGQPPDLAAKAREYVLLVQPALAGIALRGFLQLILQAEGHIMANFYISFFVFCVAPALQYLLIHYLNLGLRGAGIAFSIYNCLYLVIMVPYMLWADLGHVFVPRREALNPAGMWAHLSLAIPGLFCQLLEWASMELVSIVAGTRRSARQLIGALGLCLNLEAIFCMFAVGFMVAVSIKVRHTCTYVYAYVRA
jgi:MATE family multidrug resistance protein